MGRLEEGPAKWSPGLTCHWIVHTNRGDAMRARFIVMSNGPLNRPKLPGIDGIKDYQGHTFHTSRCLMQLNRMKNDRAREECTMMSSLNESMYRVLLNGSSYMEYS